MISWLLSSNQSLAQLPENLKPVPQEQVLCLTDAQALQCQNAIDENASCHQQIKQATNTDWVTLAEVFVLSFAMGYAVAGLTR